MRSRLEHAVEIFGLVTLYGAAVSAMVLFWYLVITEAVRLFR